MTAYLALNLLDALAFEYRVRSVQDQFAKVINIVTLPVLDIVLQLQNRFSTLQSVDNVVGANQYRACCRFTLREGFLLFMIQSALFAKLLHSRQEHGSIWRHKRHARKLTDNSNGYLVKR